MKNIWFPPPPGLADQDSLCCFLSHPQDYIELDVSVYLFSTRDTVGINIPTVAITLSASFPAEIANPLSIDCVQDRIALKEASDPTVVVNTCWTDSVASKVWRCSRLDSRNLESYPSEWFQISRKSRTKCKVKGAELKIRSDSTLPIVAALCEVMVRQEWFYSSMSMFTIQSEVKLKILVLGFVDLKVDVLCKGKPIENIDSWPIQDPCCTPRSVGDAGRSNGHSGCPDTDTRSVCGRGVHYHIAVTVVELALYISGVCPNISSLPLFVCAEVIAYYLWAQSKMPLALLYLKGTRRWQPVMRLLKRIFVVQKRARTCQYNCGISRTNSPIDFEFSMVLHKIAVLDVLDNPLVSHTPTWYLPPCQENGLSILFILIRRKPWLMKCKEGQKEEKLLLKDIHYRLPTLLCYRPVPSAAYALQLPARTSASTVSAPNLVVIQILYVTDLSRAQRTLSSSLQNFSFDCIGSQPCCDTDIVCYRPVPSAAYALQLPVELQLRLYRLPTFAAYALQLPAKTSASTVSAPNLVVIQILYVTDLSRAQRTLSSSLYCVLQTCPERSVRSPAPCRTSASTVSAPNLVVIQILYVTDLSRAQRTLSSSLQNFSFDCIGSQTDDELVISKSLGEFGRLIALVEDERDRMVSPCVR
ncbi:Rho GTPase-activating protein 42 [Homalodisca vitripennis]|nr:Rho GTPase-activating protein 42 [Homalodisca vitripennis]